MRHDASKCVSWLPSWHMPIERLDPLKPCQRVKSWHTCVSWKQSWHTNNDIIVNNDLILWNSVEGSSHHIRVCHQGSQIITVITFAVRSSQSSHSQSDHHNHHIRVCCQGSQVLAKDPRPFSYVWRASFVRVQCRIHACDMTVCVIWSSNDASTCRICHWWVLQRTCNPRHIHIYVHTHSHTQTHTHTHLCTYAYVFI